MEDRGKARSSVSRDGAWRGGAGAQPRLSASPQNLAPRRPLNPPSPPRRPAGASASPLWSKAPRPPSGAREWKVLKAVEGGGAAGAPRGWLDWLLEELGVQAPQGLGLGALTRVRRRGEGEGEGECEAPGHPLLNS